MELVFEMTIASKLAAAFALGGVFGFDRERKEQSSGIRTYAVVSMDAAWWRDPAIRTRKYRALYACGAIEDRRCARSPHPSTTFSLCCERWRADLDYRDTAEGHGFAKLPGRNRNARRLYVLSR